MSSYQIRRFIESAVSTVPGRSGKQMTINLHYVASDRENERGSFPAIRDRRSGHPDIHLSRCIKSLSDAVYHLMT